MNKFTVIGQDVDGDVHFIEEFDTKKEAEKYQKESQKLYGDSLDVYIGEFDILA